MERKILRKPVGNSKVFDAEEENQVYVSIDDVINFFIDTKHKGATHIEWSNQYNDEYRSPFCEALPFYMAEETDEEFEIRRQQVMMYNSKILQRNEQIDRMEYERLRIKFEK